MAQRFRLARVLNFREAQLSMAVQDLTRAENEVRSVERALTQVEEEQYSLLSRSASWQERPAADLRLVAQYLTVLEQRQQSLGTELISLREQLARAREIVIERHRAVDVLNRLQERQMSIARQEEGRQEQRAIDEVNSARAIDRSRREEQGW